ncbi:MAG TPA: DUF1572 family protein [Pyrinomonadaceae bacterium]|nr:DUF1572 family protein [Pyrinomonadaceae bacterium]
MSETFGRMFLDDALKTFRDYKALAEKACAQISDEEFFRAIDPEANSVAVVVKHMAGNMLSRWTDFLTSDGEKPWRERDAEFEVSADATREELMGLWERGWSCVFEAVEPLQAEDVGRKVLIRGEAHTVLEAVNRQLTHYAYHVGQIVLLAKHMRSAGWESLSIPKGKSQKFNAALGELAKEGRRAEGSRLAPDPSVYSEEKKSENK